MRILDRIKERININNASEDRKKLLALKDDVASLQQLDHYIGVREYTNHMHTYQKLMDEIMMMEEKDLLFSYSKKQHISVKEIKELMDQYDRFDELVNQHNQEYIEKEKEEEKDYLDHILDDCDPDILLDDDQRNVVLSDADHCLVVAGAGAGKTTTIAAKVKYLVEKQNVPPSSILVISFTNKAVQELRNKINRDLNIDCPIATFHSTGYALLRKQSDETLTIFSSDKSYYVILDYFKSDIMKNEKLVDNLILFFASYFDAPFEGGDINEFFNQQSKINHQSMRSDLNEYERTIIDRRTKKAVTILNETLRSQEEVVIANYLYLNGIDYEYEPIYPYHIQNASKPYTPDFMIIQDGKTAYIEHFGISQDGRNSRYNEKQLEKYKKAIHDKINIHRQHSTTLLYTFSSYQDKRPITEHLEEQLLRAGFELRPRPNQEILEKLFTQQEDRYIRRMVLLVNRFIRNFKTNGYSNEDFAKLSMSTSNVRSKLFLEICQACYLEYERFLKESHAIDFEDMINISAKILNDIESNHIQLDFKYIIVDEYQDISRQRFDLVQALSKVTDAKIIAVGDDWQSIYAFSGSDITLFTHFKEIMGDAELLKIQKTYRNSQEVIDIAGNFIQKNDTQIKKSLISSKHITDPVIIYTYDNSSRKDKKYIRSGSNYAYAKAVETVLGQIILYSKEEKKDKVGSILLLGRFGFDGDKLEKTGLFEYNRRGNKLICVKYPKLDITFMTAHASKGLGYDHVIIVNGQNGTYGFPAKIQDDPVLKFVVREDRSYQYAEERRLFYVAMTRTKNRVYIIAPEQNPSEFLVEIKREYKNVVLNGNWNENYKLITPFQKNCPICGYPLQYRYHEKYGLRLFICTNDPEICDFMTNEYQAGKLSIMKCDSCQDGYLIAKRGVGDEYFLGCTNYNSNGHGCNRSISKKKYYALMGYPDDPVVVKPKQDVKIYQAEELNISSTRSKQVVNRYSDLNRTLYIILHALINISTKRYYGIGTLVEVLRGSKNKKVINNELDQVLEYGALKEYTYDEIKIMIEWLIEKGFILRTKEKYPVLHITAKGIRYGEEIKPAMMKELQQRLEVKKNEGHSFN